MEMSNWQGAAGVCINKQNEVLMVLQGVPGEDKKWTVPAGGLEHGESLRECCAREFQDVTGFAVAVGEELTVKKGQYENSAVSFELHYFRVEITSGALTVFEGDDWIEAVTWQPISKLTELELAYPDDVELIGSLSQN